MRVTRATAQTSGTEPAVPEERRPELPTRNSANLALRSTVATNFALAIIAVATGVIAPRLLGPSGEGELAAIQTWPLLLGTLSMLGLDSALVYFISREPDKGKQLTSTATLVGLLSSLLVGAIAWFALPFLLSAQQPDVISAARVYLLVGVLYAVVGIPIGSLRGANSFAIWNLFRIAPALAWLGILCASWFFRSAHPIPLSRWYLGAMLCCGSPILIVVKRRLQGRPRPDRRLARKLLRFGLPSAVTSLPQTINLRFDQLLIIAFLPARSLGFYVVAVAWSGGVAPLLSAIGAVLFPQVSAEPDMSRRGHLLATALQGGAVVAAVTSLPFILLAPVALPLVFGARYAPSIPSALVLVPAGAILAWAGIAEEGLRGLGRPTTVLVAESVAAVVTLASLPVLLHFFGIMGAAVASLLGYTTIAVFTASAISRSTHLPLHKLMVPSPAAMKSMTLGGISTLPGRHRRAPEDDAAKEKKIEHITEDNSSQSLPIPHGGSGTPAVPSRGARTYGYGRTA
jgi:O-antigen/teichoic acid export membrane protein